MTDTKICIHCKEEKSLGSYSLETVYSGRARKTLKVYRTSCRACRSKQKRGYSRTPAGRERKRMLTLKYRHGLLAQEYLEMVDKQENLCAICGNPPGSKALAVDHDHMTNRTRELLCVSCNFALGWFRDDTEVMRKAILYIEKHDELSVTKAERSVVIEWGNRTTPFVRRGLR